MVAEYIVKFVRKTLLNRGRIWEGFRPLYEASGRRDQEIEYLLSARIMVPSNDPNGGYVSPESDEAIK